MLVTHQGPPLRHPPRRNVARRRRHEPGSRTRPAFSLLELLITVAIMAILAAIAVPRISNSTDRYRLDLAMARLERDLISARELAMATSSTRSVVFDTADLQYSIPSRPDPAGRFASYTVRLGEPPYQLGGLSADLTGRPAIEFNGFGIPVSGAKVRLSLGGRNRLIEVKAGSGAIVREP